MNRTTCPICNDLLLVEQGGPADSPILLVGSQPGKLEVARGVPWIGQAGRVLDAELGRAGIQRSNCRVTNLWMHDPPGMGTQKKPNPLYEPELNWHFKQLLNEMSGRPAVFIMGADTCEVFNLGAVSKISGMKVESTLFPKSVTLAVASVNPALALREVLGEVRLAIENFAVELKREEV